MTLTHDEYLELVKKCNRLNKEYYQDNQSSVTDSQYDKWYQQLKSYENNHPTFNCRRFPHSTCWN